MSDQNDEGFMIGMKKLFGMSKEEVEEFIEHLDNNSLLDLTDAVSKNDKDAAEKILKSFDGNVHKRKPKSLDKNHQFAIGDDVKVKTGDDYEDATIFRPEAPGNTVGVKIKGKPRMVDKEDIYLKEDGMLGMTSMPSIQRIQQLAGLPQIDTQVVSPDAAVETEISNPDIENSDFQEALCALDTLDEALPNIRLADLKVIRQRLSNMQIKMNESITEKSPQGRSRKK